MTHKIDIWSKRKEDDRGFIIEANLIITEEMLLEWVIEKYNEEHQFYINTNREYYAQLNSTTI